jgi:hypothetical protein
MLAGAVVLFTLVMVMFSFAFLRRDSTGKTPIGKPRRPVGPGFVLWGGVGW